MGSHDVLAPKKRQTLISESMSRLPSQFREPHLKSMGPRKISRVTKQLCESQALSSQETFPTWWRHQMETFSALLALCALLALRLPANSPHKGQWHVALIFSLIWAWKTGWVNNRNAGDLRFHRNHYDVIVKRWLEILEGELTSKISKPTALTFYSFFFLNKT